MYKSIQSVCSLRKLRSTESRMCLRESPERTSASPVRKPTFVAITTSSRRPRSASPSIRSDSPLAYPSAVSKKFTPASSAR